MCGVAGIFLKEGLVDPNGLKAMLHRIASRGPDRMAYHLENSVGLAHARLSVIDLQSGDQPLFAEEGGLALIANGEIYNYVELRAELESCGAVFATGSDCEVILHGYRYHGERFIERLNGMFAFALYDRARERMLLVRDRLGIKPLFFVETPTGVYFGSQQKALYPCLPSLQADPAALAQILACGFNSGFHGVARDVQRVMPGECVILEQGSVMARWRYWRLLTIQSSLLPFEAAVEQFEALMQQVTREHLRSDVPFALLFSGGLDSMTALEWIRREDQRPIHLFTASFVGATNQDDLQAATAVARRFGLPHTIVDIDRKMLLSHLPFAVWATDDLIADHAIVPTSLLAREVSQDYKVVFSGEGGDELFAGYGRYRRLPIQRWLANLRHPGSGGFRTRSQLPPALARTLLDGKLQREAPGGRSAYQQAWQETPGYWSALQRMQYIDLVTELVDQLLVKVDRTLMAWGLEGRVPLLDHRLVEFALAMPDNLKLREGEGKYFLKRWLEPLFGKELVQRPKRGFSVPVSDCFDEASLRRLEQVLPRHRAFEGLFKEAGIRALIRQQAENKAGGGTLWSLLQIAIWHRLFVTGNAEKPEPFTDPIEFIAG